MIQRKPVKPFYLDGMYAAKYGVHEAIILNNFIYWLNENVINKHNYIEGRHWTYDTIETMHKKFFFLTHKQIRIAIENLIQCNVLMKGNYNADKMNRTTWYAFVNETEWIYEDVDNQCKIPSSLLESSKR